MKYLGFTGTRAGLTPHQQKELDMIFSSQPDSALLHGDCVGADAEAHAIALKHGRSIFIHPGPDKQRAFCKGAVRVSEPQPYLKRNHTIVDQCDELIACPRTHKEELRSGTWATIRYAHKSGKLLNIIWPTPKQI